MTRGQGTHGWICQVLISSWGGSPPNIWKTLQKEWFWGIRSGIVLDHDLKFRISSDFNWVQFTFNWFKFTFNWFSFESVRKSIEKKRIPIDFNLVTFNWFCICSHHTGTHFFAFEGSGPTLARWKLTLAIPKKGIKGFMNKSDQEKVGHNRSPHQRTHYWRSELLIGYPLKKWLGVFFVCVLIRNSMLQEIWHICFSWIKQNH